MRNFEKLDNENIELETYYTRLTKASYGKGKSASKAKKQLRFRHYEDDQDNDE